MTNLPPSQEDISPEVIFGEPISVYTDAQAVEDGFVVDLDSSRTYGFWGFPSIG